MISSWSWNRKLGSKIKESKRSKIAASLGLTGPEETHGTGELSNEQLSFYLNTGHKCRIMTMSTQQTDLSEPEHQQTTKKTPQPIPPQQVDRFTCEASVLEGRPRDHGAAENAARWEKRVCSERSESCWGRLRCLCIKSVSKRCKLERRPSK